MKYLVALAALLCAAPATPQIATGPNTPYYAGMPPAQYDGTGAAVLILTDDVSAYCGTAPEGLVIIACVRRSDAGTPFLFMPNPKHAALEGDPYARILYHEAAHLQGWAYNHPM